MKMVMGCFIPGCRGTIEILLRGRYETVVPSPGHNGDVMTAIVPGEYKCSECGVSYSPRKEDLIVFDLTCPKLPLVGKK